MRIQLLQLPLYLLTYHVRRSVNHHSLSITLAYRVKPSTAEWACGVDAAALFLIQEGATGQGSVHFFVAILLQTAVDLPDRLLVPPPGGAPG